jgi:hypothetical protein
MKAPGGKDFDTISTESGMMSTESGTMSRESCATSTTPTSSYKSTVSSTRASPGSMAKRAEGAEMTSVRAMQRVE